MSITVAPPRRRTGHSAGTPLDVGHGPHDYGVKLPSLGISLIILVVLWVAYSVLGYQTTVNSHVVVFDALDRLSRAYLVWHNDPPKLASIGFFYPPLTTMVLLPLALISPLATGLTALPVTSGFFAALTIVMLDRTLARCDMAMGLRLVTLLVFAVNPLWLFYSGNGMAEAVYCAFLAIGLYFFVSWYVTTEPRYLIGSGITVAILVLTRYGFIVWAVLLSVLIGVALARRHARRMEVEGSVIAFAAPVIYVVGLWIVFNALIVGDPFGWISSATSTQAVNSTGINELSDLTFNQVAKRLLELNVAVFPLAFLVVPGLVVAFVTQRSDMALWLASFVVIGIVIIGANALITGREGLLALRDAFPMMVTSLVGAGWLYRSFVGARLGIWLATVAILVLGWFTAWHGMKTYPFQSLEQAYTRTLFTGDNQEGTKSIGGYTVGIDPEAQMAAFVKQNVEGKDAILSDNAKTFGVILLNGQPQKYFLRVDKGDAKWLEIRDNPWGRAKYFLVTNNPNSGDLIDQKYPGAAKGAVPGLTPVHATDRYTLIRVASRPPARAAAPAAAATTTGAAGAAARTTTTSTPNATTIVTTTTTPGATTTIATPAP